MDVLFITASRLGDAVLSTGLLDHVVRTYPGARITIICGTLPASLFEGVPGLEQIVPLKKMPYKRHWLELWQKTSARKWDMVIDLRNSAVSRLVRAKSRFIAGRRADRALHKVEQAAAAMKLDYVPAPRLWVTAGQAEKARALIPDGGPVLAVGPTANWAAKTWPPGCFIELISHIIGPGGHMPYARVAVFAAPGEEDQAWPVLDVIPEELRIDMIAKAEPGAAAAALARCSLYIGNDSGLMHCAAAAGIPTLGLFGPSLPQLYRPWGAHATYVRTPETYEELTGYDGYDPESAPCLMSTLNVEDVIRELDRFYVPGEPGAATGGFARGTC